MTIWILALGLIHVSFLIAIGRRLTHLDYPGSQILSVISASFAIWAVAFFVGATFGIDALTIYAGLPVAIVTALLRHGWLELRVLLETPAERARRLGRARQEEADHVEHRQADERVIERMVPVKNYVGDDQSILAISDLGRLRDHGIPCRIEGNLVKTLFIEESMTGAAASVIALEVGDVGPGMESHPSPS